MKLHVSQEALADALTMVSKAVSNKTTIPLLTGVYLEAAAGKLILKATDLELAMEYVIDTPVEDFGAVVLPTRYLTDLIRRVPFGEIDLSLDKTNFTTTIRWGKNQYTLHGSPPDEFPQLPDFSEQNGLTLSQPVLRNVLRQTIFAVGRDETRPYLTGVQLLIQGEQLSGVATDSVRIASAHESIENVSRLALNSILPGRSLNELFRILSNEKESEIRLIPTANQILFDLGQVKVITRLLEGQYPDVMRLVPQQYRSSAVISKALFQEAIERAALITTDDALKFHFDTDLLTITAYTPALGRVHEEVPIALQGDALEVGFNARYLLEGVKAIDSADFRIDLSGSRNPSRIQAADDQRYTYVILPLITY